MSISDAESILRAQNIKFQTGSVTVGKRRGKSHTINYRKPNGSPGTYTAQLRLETA